MNENKKPDVIIIGAGIAGLSAGCYAQMNGFSAQIFEMHTKPGGLCTSWKRKGYTFDYCIHWLVGSHPKHDFYRIWEELGIIQGRTFIDHDVFTQIENADGRRIVLYTNPDRLKEHLTELFPGDATAIAEMCASIRTLTALLVSGLSTNPFHWGKLIRAVPAFRLMRSFGGMSMREYAARFSDPWLRHVISHFFGMEEMPVSAFLVTLGWMHAGCAGYPIGGSLPMARAIEERFRSLGGEINFGTRVDRILTSEGSAYGIRLADGIEHRARWVISAADAHATFKHMLEDRFPESAYERYFAQKKIFPSLIQISLGIAGSLDVPQSVSWPLNEPIMVDPGTGGSPNKLLSMDLHQYGFDPTMAPEGHTSVVVRFGGTPKYWRNLAQTEPARYKSEKERILAEVTDRLEQRFPGIKERTEVTDVSTPWTVERYTGNWDGCMEGWLMTPESLEEAMKGSGLPLTVTGLSHFVLAGQWTSPGGGLPPSAKSGRDAVKHICRAEGRRFRTSVPSIAPREVAV